MSAATLRPLLERLLERGDLDALEAETVLRALADPTLPPAMAGAVLAALRTKGVVASEVRGFARGMRALARRPQLPAAAPGAADIASRAIDIVGTGGDASRSFNLSTGTSLLVAACGVPVIKHGNRSISSQSGSADVLEQLGLRLPLDERAAGECLAATGFTFLFAPHYHPAMKAIAPIRQALGVRTVFNILGPLTNPAQPAFHLIGAYAADVAVLMSDTLAGLAAQRAFVVHSDNGWDEPTPAAPFTLHDVREGRVTTSRRSAADYGLATCDPAALAGGTAIENAAALAAVLRGQDRGPHRDALLLGAALALEVAGAETQPRAALARAARAIDDGVAARTLDALARFGAASSGPAS
jgi:anthranilate phosphoribosyltransferase